MLKNSLPVRVMVTALALCLVSGWLLAANPTAVYRSVSPGYTKALATGESKNILEISGSVATFSAALPDQVGVGDALVYNDGKNICFVHGRTDASHFTVSDSDGKAPAASQKDSTWAIYRAYTSLQEALRGNENAGIPESLRNFDSWKDGKDISSAKGSNQIWNIACYCDDGKADTTPAVVNEQEGKTPWVDDGECYVNIYTPCLPSEVGKSQRHAGVWDATKYRLEVEDADAITCGIWTKSLRITGLQVLVKRSAAKVRAVAGLKFYNSQAKTDFRVSYNIIACDNPKPDGWVFGITAGPGPMVFRVWNNVIYGFGSKKDGLMHGGIFLSYDATSYIYNNTVYNSGCGIVKCYAPKTGKTYLKNNLCYNNAANFTTNGQDVFDPSSSNNLSGPQLDDAPGTDACNKTEVKFADVSKFDFHLSDSDSGAKGKGIDLSKDPVLPIGDDIAGKARSGKWDIGAFAAPAK